MKILLGITHREIRISEANTPRARADFAMEGALDAFLKTTTTRDCSAPLFERALCQFYKEVGSALTGHQMNPVEAAPKLVLHCTDKSLQDVAKCVEEAIRTFRNAPDHLTAEAVMGSLESSLRSDIRALRAASACEELRKGLEGLQHAGPPRNNDSRTLVRNALGAFFYIQPESSDGFDRDLSEDVTGILALCKAYESSDKTVDLAVAFSQPLRKAYFAMLKAVPP